MTIYEQYAHWTAAGISPDLITKDTLTQADDMELLTLAKATPEALTELGADRVAKLRARWRLATNHVIIAGLPVCVDVDSDYSWEGEETGYVGQTAMEKVRGRIAVM